MFFWFIIATVLCFIVAGLYTGNLFCNWKYFYFLNRLLQLMVIVMCLGVGFFLLLCRVVPYIENIRRGL